MLRQTMGTNNGKVTDDISIRYQYGEGESWACLWISWIGIWLNTLADSLIIHGYAKGLEKSTEGSIWKHRK